MLWKSSASARTAEKIHPYLGPKLTWYREAKGLSARQLGRITSISPSSVCAYENQIRTPPYSAACKLASALGIPVSYLWDHTPPPTQQ